MVEFDVDLVEGGNETVKLPEYLPTRVGMKARSKLQIGLEGDQKKANIEMENALEKADDAMYFIVNEMMDKGDTDLDVDDIAYHSFQEIGEHYWTQVQGEKAKN